VAGRHEQETIKGHRLAESCNRMLKRLETSFEAEIETKEQMRRFIADASHELRTQSKILLDKYIV